jgi:hypothetical protein
MSNLGHFVIVTVAYKGADKGVVDGADEEASSISACRIARKEWIKLMLLSPS